MRKSTAAGLAAAAFVCGAWLSPGLTAQNRSNDIKVPVSVERGQRITIATPGGATCAVDRVFSQWVRCEGGEWRNLETGYGFRIQEPTR